jgi:hypothetical protein
MEPSGTYGDVLRRQLEKDVFPVFMVSGKRTYDAKEIFDGVPSLHDAKSAAIIARLHADGLSTRLPDEVPERRQLKAALAILELYQERYLELTQFGGHPAQGNGRRKVTTCQRKMGDGLDAYTHANSRQTR